MARVKDEYDRAENQRAAIENAETVKEAILHAFDGIAMLLLDVLSELRDIPVDREQ